MDKRTYQEVSEIPNISENASLFETDIDWEAEEEELERTEKHSPMETRTFD